MSNDEQEVVLAVGAEGGEARIVRALTSQGLAFWVETNEAALDDDDMPSLPQRPRRPTFAAALQDFDRYPWPELVPLVVAPEYRSVVWEAAQPRAGRRLEDWRRLCLESGRHDNTAQLRLL